MFIELTTRVGKTTINTSLIEFFTSIKAGSAEKTSIHMTTGNLAVMEDYTLVKKKIGEVTGRIPTKAL